MFPSIAMPNDLPNQCGKTLFDILSQGRFCYDKQPLKISKQSQHIVSEIVCCNYQIVNFLKNGFKVKKNSEFLIKCTVF